MEFGSCWKNDKDTDFYMETDKRDSLLILNNVNNLCTGEKSGTILVF